MYDLFRNLWSNLLRNLCYNLRSDLNQLHFMFKYFLMTSACSNAR